MVAPLKPGSKSISTANPTKLLNFFPQIPIRLSMNIIQLLAIFVMISSLAFAATGDLQKVLQIKPGAKLDKGVKTSGTTPTYSYEIETEKDLVQSVSIELAPSLSPEKFLKNDTKGFCLVQPREHMNLNRFFFFDMETKRRYELNVDKKIIGILIQDIPGARANRECTFGSINPKVDKK